MTPRSVLCAGLGLALLAAAGDLPADPDEAWVTRAALPADVRPLLVLIVDRSAAMNETVAVRSTYDPGTHYGSGLPDGSRCDPARAYWRRGPGPVPDCAAQRGLALAPVADDDGLQCAGARAALAQHGVFVAARAAQRAGTGTDSYWAALRDDRTSAVECRSDRGRHGAAAGAWYAADDLAGAWSADASHEIPWDRAPFADPYIFYTGNYLNWLRAGVPSESRTLSDIVAESIPSAIASTDELDVAVVLTSGGDGGYVALAPVPASAAAPRMATLLAGAAAGSAPLAETLVEAASWLAGASARFGGVDRADPAAFDAGQPGNYRSPLTHACRPVTLGYLTAGQSSDDESAAQAASALPGFVSSAGSCGPDCLASLANWLEAADVRLEQPGKQSAEVAWIAGPASAVNPGDVPSMRFDDPLATVQLIARTLQRDAAVASEPFLSAAALLQTARLAHDPTIVYGLSAPRAAARWFGNAFRYAWRDAESPLEPPTVVDRDGEPALDARSALPDARSRSFWSDTEDAILLAGGAAGRLPAPAARRLYADLASDRLADPANRLVPGNARITRNVLGLAATDPETPAGLIGWLADQPWLGDPGRAAPVIVDYPEDGLRLAFIATQDGLLHAFDLADGSERWAWMPLGLLPHLKELSRDRATTVRMHGIDGPLVLHRHDADGDGRIEPGAGEHLILLFGLGRGGNGYAALDVSLPLEPRVLWSLAPAPGADTESWAPPVVAKLTIAGAAQNAGHWVAMLTGGYDRAFDASGARERGAGNELLIVDALTGAILWRAAGDAGDVAQLRIAGFDASLPSSPRVLDRDGDGELDRAYLMDVTGRLWRFDFTTGRPTASIATVRLVAQLGDGQQRFFAAPDVSTIRRNGRIQIALAAASGWLSRTLDTTVTDRVYVLFETESGPVLDDDSLVDVTDAADALRDDAPGWYLRLDRAAGEKVIGSTVTFDRVLRFQTYQPLPASNDAPCGPPRGVRRLHAYTLRTGRPWNSVVDGPAAEPEELAGSGLPAALHFAFPRPAATPCAGCRSRPFGIAGPAVIDPRYGGDPVRTSWRKLPPDSP